jgi:hypothetical protein
MLSSLSLSGVPQQVLDMTTDFTPLFVGLVVMLGLSLLGIVFAIGVHDTRQAQTKERRVTNEVVSLPKAA